MTFVLEVFMNIIIVGCGKVGYTLVEQLGGENHNITVIDTNEEKVNSITDDLDAMGIVGNGVSFQTLSEAGIDHADLLIAVTGSDEQNLLCCVIAKKAGDNVATIARVRNPAYSAGRTGACHDHQPGAVQCRRDCPDLPVSFCS